MKLKTILCFWKGNKTKRKTFDSKAEAKDYAYFKGINEYEIDGLRYYFI